jgi:hypothetical protein
MLSESRKIASMKDNRYARKAFDDWKRYGGAGVEMMASVLVGAFGGYGRVRPRFGSRLSWPLPAS